MVKSCAAPNCKNRADKSLKEGVTFHMFPRKVKKRQNWLKQMMGGTLLARQPSAFSVICSEHFEDSSFRYLNGKRLVKDEAFPTKFFQSKEKTVSSGFPIEMNFTTTESDTLIDNLTKVDHELNTSVELSDTDQTSDNKDGQLSPTVSAYGRDLVIAEEQSSQVDLEKSDDLAVDIMFEVSDFPESSEQITHPTEVNLSSECYSQFIEEVHLEITSDLTGPIQTSFQHSPVLLHPTQKLTNLNSYVDVNKNKNVPLNNNVPLKNNVPCEKIDLLTHKNHKAKVAKCSRGPSKKAKLAITLFKKAMRLSGFGLDVFLVVQELPNCPTYWGTKRFTKNFMQSKRILDFEKSKCFNAEEYYNFSSSEEIKKHSIDDEKSEKNSQDSLLESDDHTYSLCNNIKDRHWKTSKSGQTTDNSTKNALHHDLLLTSNPREFNSIADEINIVEMSEKSSLSEKIDQLIAQNDKICSTWSVLSADKPSEKKKIFHLPSATYDSTYELSEYSYNPKDTSMDDFNIRQQYLMQQNKKRTKVHQIFEKNQKSLKTMESSENRTCHQSQ